MGIIEKRDKSFSAAMTLYMPTLMRIFERLGQFVQERPRLLAWTRSVCERYQNSMGHRRLGMQRAG